MDTAPKTISVKNNLGQPLCVEQTILNSDMAAGTYAVYKITGSVNITVSGGTALMFSGIVFGEAGNSDDNAADYYVSELPDERTGNKLFLF
jgi:predicted P-loop ATPase/GTPase